MKQLHLSWLSLLLAYVPLAAQTNTQLLSDRINFRKNALTLGLLEWDGTHLGLYNVSGKTGNLILGSDNDVIFRSGGPNEHLRVISNGRIGIGAPSAGGKVGIFHHATASVPHLEIQEAQSGDYARIQFNNNNSVNYWQIAAKADTDPFFNLSFSDGNLSDDILRINGTDKQVIIGTTSFFNVNAKLQVNNDDSGDENSTGTTYDIYTRPTHSIWTRYGMYAYVSGAAEGVDIATQGQKIGLSANARSSGSVKTGVYAYAGVGTGTNYGVQAIVNGVGGAESYAVYAQASGGNSTSSPPVWAGYFAGDVFTTGSYLPSDQKLKSGIRKADSSLDRLRQLPVRSYRYQNKYQQKMGLDQRPQTGFLAHEMGSIFPELTREVAQPLNTAEEVAAGQKEAFLRFTGVNYVGLIPHLTRAVQEQQEQIETQETRLSDQQTQIDELQLTNKALLERLARLEARLDQEHQPTQEPIKVIPLSGGVLEQNAPNPFSKKTRISYVIPEQVQEAQLQIIDTQGRLLKTIPIESRGRGEIELQGNFLNAGQYTYNLVLDGRTLATRKMVLTN